MHSLHRLSQTACFLAASGIASACSDDASTPGSASVSVLLEPEDTITNGLEAGDELENIRDGWSVHFDKYLLAVGHVDVHLATDEDRRAEDANIYAVDLTKVPAAGTPLWKLRDLQSGRWELFFEQTGAGDSAKRHESVEQSDFDDMVENDYTYVLHGTLTNPEGRSCPPSALAKPGDKTSQGTSGKDRCYPAPEVRFELGVEAETTYGPCEIDGVPGFSVGSDGKQTVSVTMHGDHLFFNGFPEGGEGGVMRLAQWLADCDLDLDGTVTRDELEQVAPEQLSELNERFQLGGSPISPLTNMLDYVRSQLKTQGHMNGEGECPIDGTAHEH